MTAATAVVGEDLGARTTFDFRRSGAGDAGPFADVGGDVIEVLAGDDVAGHRDAGVAVDLAWERDLRLDDAFHRVGVVADRARGGERIVEVGTDLGGGPGLRQFVADAALLDEERAAVFGVGAGRAAARSGHHEGDQREEREQRAERFRGAIHGAQGERESICRRPG